MCMCEFKKKKKKNKKKTFIDMTIFSSFQCKKNLFNLASMFFFPPGHPPAWTFKFSSPHGGGSCSFGVQRGDRGARGVASTRHERVPEGGDEFHEHVPAGVRGGGPCLAPGHAGLLLPLGVSLHRRPVRDLESQDRTHHRSASQLPGGDSLQKARFQAG